VERDWLTEHNPQAEIHIQLLPRFDFPDPLNTFLEDLSILTRCFVPPLERSPARLLSHPVPRRPADS
jgi:hypothetical protein